MPAPILLSAVVAATMAAQALLGLLLTDRYRDAAWIYLVVLAVNAAIAMRRGLAEAPGEVPLRAALAAADGAVTVWLFAWIRQSPAPADPAGRAPAPPAPDAAG